MRRPPWWRILAPAAFFGFIGWGLCLLAVISRTGRWPTGLWWLPVMTMSGLGAGTGAGLGAQSDQAFAMGAVGAAVGAGGGVTIALVGTKSWVVAAAAAGAVVAVVSVGVRQRSVRTSP